MTAGVWGLLPSSAPLARRQAPYADASASSPCCSCSCQGASTSTSRSQAGRQQTWAPHRQLLRVHRPSAQRLAPVRGTELGDLIGSEEEYRKVLEDNDIVVIDWMARWCRKCIYLSPKLKKLMADDFPEIPIIFIDVNAVPGNIVYDAGVRKMPTITIFKHGEKVREHIAAEGGLKAVTHIREMIRDFVEGGGAEADN